MSHCAHLELCLLCDVALKGATLASIEQWRLWFLSDEGRRYWL